MITWSGLVFFLFTYMPVAVDVLYPQGEARERFMAEAYGREPEQRYAERLGSNLVPLVPLFEQAEQRWGRGSVSRINVDNPDSGAARESALGSCFGLGR